MITAARIIKGLRSYLSSVGLLHIRFLGGASEVGRSGILVRDAQTFLFDYGVKIDDKPEYPLPSGKIDAFMLSHAHLDHSGFSPFLYHDSMPPTYCTEPTMRLAELLIEDSMKIARSEHYSMRFHNRQLKDLLQRYSPHAYGESIDFGDYEITLHDAGHICGSAITSVERRKDGKRIVYTGDFKLSPQLLQNGAEVVKSDVLIMESTYATKEHGDREELARSFIEGIKETIDNGGTALVPVFAVGRSQEILALIHKNGLSSKTFLDGMARSATEIVIRNGEFMHNSSMLEEALENVTVIEREHHRSRALEGGNIILTTSGMLSGGPVLSYITKLNKESKIFLTGYQVEGTNGRRLMNGEPIMLGTQKYRVETPFVMYDFSAHSGMEDLHEYARRSNPEAIMCVHGSPENTAALAEGLKEEGFNAYAPVNGDEIKIDL